MKNRKISSKSFGNKEKVRIFAKANEGIKPPSSDVIEI